MSKSAYKRLSAADEESQDGLQANLIDASSATPSPTTSASDISRPVFSDIPLHTDDGSAVAATTTTTGSGEMEHEFPDWIRLVEIGKPRRELNVDFRWSVREFKQRFFGEAMTNGASVRLIYQGRMMHDDNATLQSYNIVPNGFVHAVVSQSKGQQSVPGFQPPQTQSGCAHEDFDNGLLTDEQLAQQLQNEGREDSVFIPMGRGGRRNRDEQTNNPSEFACGFLTGLLLGIWAFLFLLSPRWRHSRRFRSGVILGLLVNVVVTIARNPATN